MLCRRGPVRACVAGDGWHAVEGMDPVDDAACGDWCTDGETGSADDAEEGMDPADDTDGDCAASSACSSVCAKTSTSGSEGA